MAKPGEFSVADKVVTTIGRGDAHVRRTGHVVTARPLKVVMPCLTFVPGGMGGSETYVRALVAGLDARDDIELTVVSPRIGAGALGARSEHVVRSVPGGASVPSRLAAVLLGAVADRPTRALMRDADVVHYPFTVPVPAAPRRVPWVTTLLDVQHRDLSAMFSLAERAYRAAAYDAAARRAWRVITISEFCRDRIHSRLGVPEEHIDVAHLGVDCTRFTPSWSARDPFVFYPATAWPHKNHSRLVQAIALVRRENPLLRLVLTGARGSELGVLPTWVEHRGQVSDKELVALYQKAACLAFPSLYEGFGLPPLEAMASGCPVAASRSGALPEICGDAAYAFDADDVPAMAAAIKLAIASPEEHLRRALKHVRQFSWSRCVQAHVDTYRRAARG